MVEIVDRTGRESVYRDACLEALRNTGARITKARLSVIDCLGRSELPLTPAEILDHIQTSETLATIDKVSVYRVLDTLHQLGLVHQVFPSGGYVACDHTGCHSGLHIMTRCSQCGEAKEHDVPDAVLAPMRWFLQNEIHFQVGKHFFQVDGLCKKCHVR